MTRQNVTFPIGNIAVIDKIDADFDFFNSIFGGLGGRAKTIVPCIKLLMCNKLGNSLAVSRIPSLIPEEFFTLLGFGESVSDRTLNRTLERIGELSMPILERYQTWITKNDFVDKIQLTDFSSTYFEGSNCPIGKLGYSRDNQPGKKQLTFGISVGINGVPTALTIQNGNVQDKVHMKKMLRICSKVLPSNSLLIFDCGGNTRKNKENILELGFQYLTLKAKKRKPYKEAIVLFKNSVQNKLVIEDKIYHCIKIKAEDEYNYIFFSEKLCTDQLGKKQRKFENAIEKGGILERRVKAGKELGTHVYDQGLIILEGKLQRILGKVQNPFITGLEGYFILESSLDAEPEEILRLYKSRDKAEKFIRDLKEGAEMRPIRHWSKNAVIGYILLIFLTNALVNLTLFLSKNPLVKNLKVLKKYLSNLTLTVLYPPNSFRIAVISNFSVEMKALLGDFVRRYGDLTVQIS